MQAWQQNLKDKGIPFRPSSRYGVPKTNRMAFSRTVCQPHDVAITSYPGQNCADPDQRHRWHCATTTGARERGRDAPRRSKGLGLLGRPCASGCRAMLDEEELRSFICRKRRCSKEWHRSSVCCTQRACGARTCGSSECASLEWFSVESHMALTSQCRRSTGATSQPPMPLKMKMKMKPDNSSNIKTY
jgi:hypothetical protein